MLRAVRDSGHSEEKCPPRLAKISHKVVLNDTSGGWLATEADPAVTSDVELLDGAGPADPVFESARRTGPLSHLSPSAPGGVIVQTFIVAGAAIGVGFLVFFAVKAALTPGSDDQVQTFDDLPAIGLDPERPDGDDASVAADSDRSGSKRNTLEDGVPEDATGNPDGDATEVDAAPPPAIASTADGESAADDGPVSVESAVTDALASGITAGLAATGNSDQDDQPQEQTDLTLLAAPGPGQLDDQTPATNPGPMPAPAAPVITAPAIITPSTATSTTRPVPPSSRPTTPVAPPTAPAPPETGQPVTPTTAPPSPTTTPAAPTTASTTTVPPTVTAAPATTTTTAPDPVTTPPTSTPATTTTVPVTTTTTEPTASTVGSVPLISSPIDGSVHTWEAVVRFEARSVTGAAEYCWQLVSSGKTVEGCETGTSFVLPAGIDGVNPGSVLVTVEAKDDAGEVMETESINLTILARQVVRSPETGDSFEPDEAITVTFAELPAATSYCVTLGQGEEELPEVCSPDPTVLVELDGFSNGPVDLSTEVFRGGQIIGRQTVRLTVVNGAGPSVI